MQNPFQDQSPLVQRFVRYISIDTQSCDTSEATPSTEKQFNLAQLLVSELKEMGLKDVSLDDRCYVMATLPSNTDDNGPVIGFIAHMDTAPDLTGENIKPRIVHYTGGDIVLDETENIRISETLFPELARYRNQDIMVTDGHTLLGADDKAGVAAIMGALDYLTSHPEVKHGTIKVGFTPDEEIGRGADHFDVEKFGADFAYTIDGGEIGELEYENFNAAAAVLKFKGLNVHPGYATGKMRNAQLLAMEYNGYLPAARPDNTSGYEGFYHLIEMKGSVEEAELHYILRDHDRELFELQKSCIQETANRMNEIYGEGTVSVHIRDQYYNMKEVIEQHRYVVEHAVKCMEQVGVKPDIKPIRGGTDGARLSFMGLPCPNIFAGGHNFHGRYEYLPLASLEKAQQVILQIATTPVEK